MRKFIINRDVFEEDEMSFFVPKSIDTKKIVNMKRSKIKMELWEFWKIMINHMIHQIKKLIPLKVIQAILPI